MTFKYIFIASISTICFLGCKSQNISYSKKHVNFLSWFLKQREEKIVSKKAATLESGYINYLSEETKISKKDSLGFLQQINANNSYLYNYETFSDKMFLEDSSVLTLSKKPAHLFLKISKPIFFNNKDLVWVFVEEYCGALCGSGIIEVYKKTNSGYELLFKRLVWIS